MATRDVAPARVGSGVAHSSESPRRIVILAVLCLSVLIINLDGTVLNVALPRIVATLHVDAAQLQWIVDAYVVVLAGLLLIAGSLGDHLGRKWVFVVGLVIFATGSALSAFSPRAADLIAARAFMGVGAAAIMPSTLSILTNVFTTPHDRARAIGLWSGTNGLGLALGPMIGGWLLAHYWWGSVFLINVPIAALAVAVVLWVVPNSRNPVASRPDLPGAALALVGVAVLLWGIIEGPGRGWGSIAIVGALGGALVLLGAFVALERHSTHPLLELSFFRSRRFSVAMSALALTIFALSGVMFLLTQFFQFTLGYSPLATGLRITPVAAVLVVVAALSTALARAIGTRVVVFVGMVLISLGLALLSLVSVHSSYVSMLPAFMLLGVGTGLAVAPSTDSVMGSVPVDLAGVGSATNSTALQVGSALGVAVLGSLLSTHYQATMTRLVTARGVPSVIARAIEGSLGGALLAAGRAGALGPSLALAARQAYVSAMIFAVDVGALIVGVAAVVVALALPARAEGDT